MALGGRNDIKVCEIFSKVEKIILDASTEKSFSEPVSLQSIALRRMKLLKYRVRQRDEWKRSPSCHTFWTVEQ